MARRPSALDFPFHADLGVVAQRRRRLLLGHHTPPNPTRGLPFRRRFAERDQTLHRRPQQRLQPVRMDQFRQSHLRKTRAGPCTFCLSQCTRSRPMSQLRPTKLDWYENYWPSKRDPHIQRRSRKPPGGHRRGQVLSNEFRMRGQCRLRNRSDAYALRRKKEIIHVGAAVYRAVGSERLIRLQHVARRTACSSRSLIGVGFPITARHADSLVEPEAAGSPPLEISAAIFTRKGHVRSWRILSDVVAQRSTKALGCGAFGDDHLPWLGIAPRWRALRNAENAHDQVVGDWFAQEAPAAMARR